MENCANKYLAAKFKNVNDLNFEICQKKKEKVLGEM
jgi:hypothetical protein